MDELTTAQIMFITLAGMEDARIKAGGGPVKRTTRPTDGISVQEYAKIRRSMRPGGDDFELMKQKRDEQADLRKHIEKMAIEELRREGRPVR